MSVRFHFDVMVESEELLHRVEDVLLLVFGNAMVFCIEEAADCTGIVDLAGDFLAVFDV